MTFQVKDPVIAARVAAPDARRVGEDQQALAIGTEVVLLDDER